MRKLQGIQRLYLDGKPLDTFTEGSSLDIGGYEVTDTRMTAFGESFGTRKPKPTNVKANVPFHDGTRLEDINGWAGELQVEMDTGQRYIVNNARLVNTPEVADGQFAVEFTGNPAEEMA